MRPNPNRFIMSLTRISINKESINNVSSRRPQIGGRCGHKERILKTHFPPGACVARDASGNISDKLTANSTGPCLGLTCDLGWNFTDCIETQSCQYGLANNLQVPFSLAAKGLLLFIAQIPEILFISSVI